MDTIERIFFHELGHYVAHSLNKKLYGRLGITEFEIYPCKEDDTFWCGHVTPKKADDFDENDSKKPPPIERLHFVLASIMYGCLFQAYYCGTNLRVCYDKFGCTDLRKWIGFLFAHRISFINKDLGKMEESYLQELVESKELDGFINITPSDYLEEKDENSFTVNLEKLDKNLDELINDHSPFYQKVVNQYEEIIQANISDVLN